MPRATNSTLTKKQEKCIGLFVETKDKYYSYLKAGYLVKGVSAIQKCDEFFNNPKIKQAIELRTKNFELIKPSVNVYLTEEITQKLEECLGLGMPISKSVIVAGIPPTRYAAYYAEGKEKVDKCENSDNKALFFRRMERAKNSGEAKLLAAIQTAVYDKVVKDEKVEFEDGVRKKVTKTKRTVNGNWQPAAWILERTRPEIYGKDRAEEADTDAEAKELGDLFRENILGSFALEPDTDEEPDTEEAKE